MTGSMAVREEVVEVVGVVGRLLWSLLMLRGSTAVLGLRWEGWS